MLPGARLTPGLYWQTLATNPFTLTVRRPRPSSRLTGASRRAIDPWTSLANPCSTSFHPHCAQVAPQFEADRRFQTRRNPSAR